MKAWLKLSLLLLVTYLIIRINYLPWQLIFSLGLITAWHYQAWSRIKLLLPVITIILAVQWLTVGSINPVFPLKLLNLSLSVMIFTALTPIREMKSLWFFMGEKGRILMTLTFNLIPIILKEAEDIKLIQSTRRKNGLAFFPIVVPLLHRVLKRSEQLTLVLSLSATGEI